jgi:FixJ family two-component response regulator
MPPIDQTQGEIFVVDDDPGVRDALSVVFTLAG